MQTIRTLALVLVLVGMSPVAIAADQIVVTSAPPAELTLFENGLVSLELVANAVPASLTSSIVYQWQRTNNGAGTFTNIPGATAPTLSFYAALADDSAHYRVNASIPGHALSVQTLLHVEADTVAPYLVTASAREPVNGVQLVGIAWDGPTDAALATDPNSYYAFDDSNFSTTFTFTSAQYRPGFPNQLFLTLDTSIAGPLTSTFTVYCDFMMDAAAVQNEGFGLSATGAVQKLTERIIGTPGLIGAGGYNVAAPGLEFTGLAAATDIFTDTNAGWDISANGWDIGNAADGLLFAGRQVTGNFDIKTRVRKFTGADQWSKAGLMARASTNANSRHITMQTTPRTTHVPGQMANNFFSMQWRDGDGADSFALNNSETNAPAYPNAWLRLQRSNSVFYGYFGTNGVDWTLHAFHDSGSNFSGAFPDTLQVGLGTSSHDQTRSLSNNAYAEYRDLYFPNPAVITAQPTPTSVQVGIHQSVSFVNLTASGQNVRYQWRLNGVAVTGATNASLTLPNTAVSQSGTYTCVAFTDGGGQVSSNVVLTVTNRLPTVANDSLTATQGIVRTISFASLTANDSDPELDPLSVLAVFHPHTASTNFALGSLTGASLAGSAHATNAFGGALVLNDAVSGVSGAAVLGEISPGARVLAFTANFNLRVSAGTAEPGDGFSFNFANDLPLGPGANPTNANTGPFTAENGVTATGLSFCLDNYRFAPFPTGGAANTSGLKVRYKNIEIAAVPIPTWNSTAFIPVSVAVTLDGQLTVLVNGTNVFGTRQISWTPAPGRFGFYARTSSATEGHAIDDLNISWLTEDSLKGGYVTITNGQVAFTSPLVACGLDTFYYLASDGQSGGTNLGTVTVNVIGTNPPVLVSCVTNQTFPVGVGCSPVTLPDLRTQLVVTDCGPLNIGQTPAPGSALALGAHLVTFRITNNGGFVTNCTAMITVADVTPPVASCPGNIITEATGPSGKVVTFTPSGSDNCSLASVVAVPPSGSTFPRGVTVVTVTATDNAGLTNACTFTVTVRDTTAPTITCPTNQIVACTSTNGAVVNYTVTSTDIADPAPTLMVTPPSGTAFPEGTNLVTALTYDSAGNTNTCSFMVIVQDRTPSLLTITPSGTNMVVCWPRTCTTYILQGVADLTAPIAWGPVGLPVAIVGSDYCVTIPATGPYKFFRLRKS